MFQPELHVRLTLPLSWWTDQPRLRCQAALMCRPGFLVQVRFLRWRRANSISWPFAWKSPRRLPLSITISIIIIISCCCCWWSSRIILSPDWIRDRVSTTESGMRTSLWQLRWDLQCPRPKDPLYGVQTGVQFSPTNEIHICKKSN